MKMYESYEASRDHCNKYLDCQDGAFISYFLPQGYYPGDNNARTVDYMREFQGAFDGVDSTATSKNLIFKTEPDEETEEWKEKELKDWSSSDVLHWIASVADSQNFSYELVNANAFNVDGKTLLSLSKKQFMDLDEKYGCLLYRALHKCLPVIEEVPSQFKLENVKTDVRLETLSTSSNLGEGLMSLASQNSGKGPPYGLVGAPNAYSGELTDSSESYPFELNLSRGDEEDEDEEASVGGGGSSSSSGRTHGPHFGSPFEPDAEECRKGARRGTGNGQEGKRPPGRPPGLKSKKEKPEKKTGKLWEFIRDLLLDPQHCPSVICWENHDDGVFRFVKSEKVAKIWGDRKGNEKMNYEKLSRAMRYYYRSKVLQPVLGRRLVYKFGPTARGWKTENPNFRH